MRFLSLLSCFIVFSALCAAEKINISFARGKWDPDDFNIVATPRIKNSVGSMIQYDDHIANKVPAGLTDKQLLSCDAGLCAMLYKKKFEGNFTVSAKMSFDYRMAPLLLIANQTGKSPDGRFDELREHLEVVIYDLGVNIWHHQYRDGKFSWYLLAFARFPLKPETVYDVSATVSGNSKGSRLTVKCNGHEFGCAMPKEFNAKNCYLGVAACEGINRFYDFKVSQ